MKTNHLLITLVLFGAFLLASCGSRARVGELRSEAQSIELGDAKSVRVAINLGAGDLQVTGGTEKLLDADFTYNIARLKPKVEYRDGTLVVQQPNVTGLPVLQRIAEYRNEWGLRLYDRVPMDLSVDVGGGVSDLQLSDLSLTRLDVALGAGQSTINLNGDWARDLHVSIDAGAADLTVLLPSDVGVRVEVDHGPTTIDAPGFVQDGNTYTNDAYGTSKVTLSIDITTGIGWLNLELVDNQ